MLKPNIFTRVKIKDFSSENAFVIPAIIIKKDTQGSYIYVAEKKSEQTTAQKRYIETGTTFEDKTMVISGLMKEDRVIVTGYDQVSNGIPIEIK